MPKFVPNYKHVTWVSSTPRPFLDVLALLFKRHKKHRNHTIMRLVGDHYWCSCGQVLTLEPERLYRARLTVFHPEVRKRRRAHAGCD